MTLKRAVRAIILGGVLGCVLSFTFMALTVPPGPHFSDSVVQIQKDCVRCGKTHPTASAVAISSIREGTFFLTARHVVYGDEPIYVVPNDVWGVPITAHVVAVAEKSDLALLFIAGLRVDTVATLAEEEPGFLEYVSLVGRTPFGLTITEGKVNQYTQINLNTPYGMEKHNLLGHTSHSHGGCSGGGLFDEDGKLVGINSASGVQGFQKITHAALAVPLKEIKRFLRDGR